MLGLDPSIQFALSETCHPGRAQREPGSRRRNDELSNVSCWPAFRTSAPRSRVCVASLRAAPRPGWHRTAMFGA